MVSQLLLAVFNHLEDKHLVMVHAKNLAWDLDLDIKGVWMHGDIDIDIHTKHEGVSEIHRTVLAKDKPSLNTTLTDHNSFTITAKGYIIVDGVKIMINEKWVNIYL